MRRVDGGKGGKGVEEKERGGRKGGRRKTIRLNEVESGKRGEGGK